jgi:hypothetical protein
MQSLRSFEWYRDSAGYRLAWLPSRGKKAFWIDTPNRSWSGEHIVNRSTALNISTTEYQGEKRVANSGMYIGGHRQTFIGKRNETSPVEIIRPFEKNEVVSLNILETDSTPNGWLDFTNRYGMLGHRPLLNRWHMSGKDTQLFICEVEHEGEWHHLRNVLFRIYYYYDAKKSRDSSFLSKFIKWESDNVVREDRGIKILGKKILPSIAMKGKYAHNSHYFEHMKRPDVLTPAAFALRDDVNSYLEKSLSLEVSFDPKTFEFTSSLRYDSLGAALVAEAIEFMAGHFEAQQCKVCGSWFRVGTERMRKDRIFCSAACKMRDYRLRKSKKTPE